MKTVRVNSVHDRQALDCFIFFSERMRELLVHSTDDSFKVSALNTPARINELGRLLRHSYATTQKAQAIVPLIDELTDGLRQDPVIHALPCRPVLIRIVDEVKASIAANKPRQLIEAADSLDAAAGLLSEYFECTQNLLVEAVLGNREKKKISQLSNILVVQLQVIGYSREYIRHISKSFLAARLAKRDSIDVKAVMVDMFSRFTISSKKYLGVTRCKQNFDFAGDGIGLFSFEKNPKEFEKIKLLEIDEATSQSQGGFDKYAVRRDIDAYDMFDAREKFFSTINAGNAVYQFLNHSPIASFAHDCLIKDVESGRELRIRQPTNTMLRGQTQVTMTTRNEVREMDLVASIGHFSDSSRKALVSALRFHKEALDSTSLQNQLIDLWAALEGFVPQPMDESPRIGSVLEHILPSQTLVYAEKKFKYVAAGVRGAGASAIKIIEDLPVEGAFEKKVAAIIVCPEFSDKLDILLKLQTVSPLLRFRMFSLYEVFSTRGKIKEEMMRHRERLEWQIRRIYITRNTLMHSATSHGNLDSLVENLHSYLDILVGSVMRASRVMGRKTTINAVLKALSACEKTYLKSMEDSKDVPLTSKDFACLFFADANPLLTAI